MNHIPPYTQVRDYMYYVQRLFTTAFLFLFVVAENGNCGNDCSSGDVTRTKRTIISVPAFLLAVFLPFVPSGRSYHLNVDIFISLVSERSVAVAVVAECHRRPLLSAVSSSQRCINHWTKSVILSNNIYYYITVPSILSYCNF